MNETLNLAALAQELQALETETFEIGEYVETADLLVIQAAALCSTTSSTTSTTSCSS